jgi:hypothetical protein
VSKTLLLRRERMKATNTNWEDLAEQVSMELSLTHGEGIVLCEKVESIINKDAPTKGWSTLIEEALNTAGEYLEYIRENDNEDRWWTLDHDGLYHAGNKPEMTFEVVRIVANVPSGAMLYYLNNGDSYKPTIAFDDEEFAFIVTSWGDWYGDDERWEEEIKEEKLRTISDDMVLPNNLEWIDELPDDSSEQILNFIEENCSEQIVMENGSIYIGQEAFVEAVVTLGFVYDLDKED